MESLLAGQRVSIQTCQAWWAHTRVGPTVEWASVSSAMLKLFCRVKTRRRNHFDLVDRVHEGEYGFLQRLADPKTGERIEPEHSFEINLEADHFTEEKYVRPLAVLTFF